MSSESLHEDAEKLGPVVTDQHRAIVSIMEELEAVDWYNQRAKATDDRELRAILEHNRDEEKEHAAMALEWLRRSDPTFSGHLKTYLFSEGSITRIEAVVQHGGAANAGASDGGEPGVSEDGSLGIGSLRSVNGRAANGEGAK
jgi:ferritin-like protein